MEFPLSKQQNEPKQTGLAQTDQLLTERSKKFFSLSLTDQGVQDLVLSRATSSNSVTVRSMLRLHGRDATQAVIALYITEADALSGGKCSADTIRMLAAMSMKKMEHRTVASILMAIRDGISYSDEDGKVYGSITWPKLSLWFDRHEEAIMNMVQDEAASRKEAPGNLGSDYLDKMERGTDKYRIDRQSRLIDKLKAKLDSK